MIEVDGSAGGGQVLRSALTLSMLTGESVAVADVRGDRPEPGLKAQHLTAVETAAAVCDADLNDGDVSDADVSDGDSGSGVELGSETVVFEPGAPTGGSYRADIGTAGSVALLFDTLLPLAPVIDEPLALTATGGTDVKWSPPLDYYRSVKLPLLRSFGLAAAVDVERRGFYPRGGGEATLRLWPSEPRTLDLAEPGPVTRARVYSTATADLADADVAERQATAAVSGLDEAGIETTERRTTYVESASAGSVVVVRVDRERGVAGLDAYGERGKPAEDVAATALADLESVTAPGIAVNAHLADQLAVVLATVGGTVAVPRVTDHLESSLDLLAAFGFDVSADDRGDRVVLTVP